MSTHHLSVAVDKSTSSECAEDMDIRTHQTSVYNLCEAEICIAGLFIRTHWAFKFSAWMHARKKNTSLYNSLMQNAVTDDEDSSWTASHRIQSVHMTVSGITCIFGRNDQKRWKSKRTSNATSYDLLCSPNNYSATLRLQYSAVAKAYWLGPRDRNRRAPNWRYLSHLQTKSLTPHLLTRSLISLLHGRGSSWEGY
jgi:hypothetical protein